MERARSRRQEFQWSRRKNRASLAEQSHWHCDAEILVCHGQEPEDLVFREEAYRSQGLRTGGGPVENGHVR